MDREIAKETEIIEQEKKRLDSIKLEMPINAPLNNFMTDSERDYFILGQKREFEILTSEKLKEYGNRNLCPSCWVKPNSEPLLPEIPIIEKISKEEAKKHGIEIIDLKLCEKIEMENLDNDIKYLEEDFSDAVNAIKCKYFDDGYSQGAKDMKRAIVDMMESWRFNEANHNSNK